MSTPDDKSKEISEQAEDAQKEAAASAEIVDAQEEGEMPTEPAGGGGGAKQKEGAGGAIILFFLIGVAVSLLIGWVIFPELLYSQKKQPIDFNHALHVEQVENGCESCHFFREDGSFSGAPKLAQCIDCHEEVQGDSPDEIKFVTQYVQQGVEVPWLIYAKQPDCVFFSHAAHVLAAHMECVTCHGPIGESEHLRIYEENRITGYSRDIWGKNIAGIKKNSWDRMKMDDCSECHQKETDFDRNTEAQTYIGRLIRNGLGVVFPSARRTNVMSSVQTEKGACFVCHQ